MAKRPPKTELERLERAVEEAEYEAFRWQNEVKERKRTLFEYQAKARRAHG